MFRNYDWQCCGCNTVREHVIQFPQSDKPARLLGLYCSGCKLVALHERLISLTAPYMGERVLNPMVAGGQFDTMGAKTPPSLPPPLPKDATFDDYRHRWNGAEYKERKAEILAVQKENKAKRKRAELIKQGANINLRRDKLPGDPKVAR